MALKPTLRRNGEHMVTLRTTHHVGPSGVYVCLAKKVWDTCDDGGRDATKAEVEEALRTVLLQEGDDALDWWDDDLDDAERDDNAERTAWARAQMERLFPEMARSL
jgi:hypothetical protein